MKFSSSTVTTLINYTLSSQHVKPRQTQNKLSHQSTLYLRQFRTLWKAPLKSSLNPHIRITSKLDACQITNLRLQFTKSSSSQPCTGRIILINNHINRLSTKRKNQILLTFFQTNINYLRFLLNFTWSTQLLAKNAWYSAIPLLPQNMISPSQKSKTSSPRTSFWNQILLTKI